MRFFTPRRLILASLLVLMASLAVSIRADARWAEAQRLGEELAGVARAVDHRRPVLVGEPVEGSAHEAYELALELLGKDADADFDLFRKLRDADAPQVPAVRVALVETYGAALEHLADGARRTDGGQPIDWDSAVTAHVPSLRAGRHLVDLAVADAERLLADGDAEAATDRLLQALQLAGDLMRGPTWVAHAVGQALLTTAGKEPLLDQGMLDRLPPAQLARLDEGLVALDRSLPGLDAVSAAEVALTVRALDAAMDDGRAVVPGFDSLAQTWRHGFSQRLRLAELVDEVVAFRQDQALLESLDWAAAELHFEGQAQLSDEGEVFLDPGLQRSLELGRRSATAYLRITREAIADRLGHERSPLRNPFGGRLEVTRDADVLRIEAPAAGSPDNAGWPAVEIPVIPNQV